MPDSDEYIEVVYRRMDGDMGVISRRTESMADIEEARPIMRRMQELYDAGVPFFTKDRIREAARERDTIMKEQLENPVIRLPGLEGETSDRYSIPLKWSNGEPFLDDPDSDDEEEEDDADEHSQPQKKTPKPRKKYRPILNYVTIANIGATSIGIPSYGFTINMCSLRILTQTLSPYSPRPVGDVKKEFEEVKCRWEASELRNHVWETLLSAEALPDVDKVVVFASSSPDGNIRYKSSTAAMQLCLGLTVGEAIKERKRLKDGGVSTVECFAQEPEFTTSDRAVLAGYNIQVLDDPDGFLALDDSTAVISFSPNVPVRLVTMDLCRPAIFIGNEVQYRVQKVTCSLGEDVYYGLTDPVTPKLLGIFEKEYRRVSITKDQSQETEYPLANHFHTGTMYLRRSL